MRAWLGLALALAPLACGDPLAGPDYRGVPLAHLGGVFERPSLAGASASAPLRVSIFWSLATPLTSSRSIARAGLIEQVSGAVALDLSTGFELNLFEPPGAAGLPPADSVPYWIGQIRAYLDSNSNGQFDECPSGDPSLCDQWSGGAADELLAYAPREIPASRSPTGHLLPAGYSRVAVPLRCAGPPPIDPPSPPPCGTLLGQPCLRDDNCGGINEICLPAPSDSQAGPFCAKRRRLGCVPTGAAVVCKLPGSGWARPDLYYFQACERDSDCRVADQFACSVASGACEPVRPIRITIETGLDLQTAWCDTVDPLFCQP